MQQATFMQKVRSEAVGLAMLSVGAVINAASVVIFLTPFNIAPSGISGLAVILNTLIGTPIGLMTLLMNVPIQYMAYRSLPSGWQTILRTVFTVFIYSSSLDILGQFVTPGIAGDDRMLNAIFGGVVGGLSTGLIMRAGGTLGGTSTLALLLQRRLGTPMSTTYLYTDVGVVFLAGLVYGWEGALYALMVIFIAGLATDYALEGPSVIRTVVIITDHADAVSDAILKRLGRGVTSWQATGMYTRQPRNVLYVTVARTQVDDLRRLVVDIDPAAFIVIGQGHTAYGEGFRPVRR